jgi:hypothetical protein
VKTSASSSNELLQQQDGTGNSASDTVKSNSGAYETLRSSLRGYVEKNAWHSFGILEDKHLHMPPGTALLETKFNGIRCSFFTTNGTDIN